MSKSDKARKRALARAMAAGTGKLGPNISPPRREPNGRLARPTRAQLEAIEQEQRMKQTAAVRRQPHRVHLPNSGDHRATDSWGRFCISVLDGVEHGSDLARAGDEYLRMWRSWRLANGLPCPFGRSSDGLMTGDDPRDPDSLWRKIEMAQSAMRDKSKAGALAVDVMCGDNRAIPAALQPKAFIALQALAGHLGVIAAGCAAPIRSHRAGASNFHYGPDPQTGD